LLDLEEIASIEAAGKPGDDMPGRVYSLLKQRWQEGARDRETGLWLMFWAWAACAEYSYESFPDDGDETSRIFREVFATFGGVDSSDPELLFAVGYWASFQPQCIGDPMEWLSIGEQLIAKAKFAKPEGFQEIEFEGRGAYGRFFQLISPISLDTWGGTSDT